ncbi:MAG: hypothetical protein K8I27_14875 [Planctomycetes bacterium]|nr:hypothetical protein [Planctomycetota bacterium]
MTEADPKFPVPKRTPEDRKAQQHPMLPEKDLLNGTLVMPDGRPAIVEDWIDSDFGLYCRTVIYSRIDTEGWGQDEHLDLIEKAGLLKELKMKRSAGLTKQVDSAGNQVWFVTVAMDKK